MSDNKQEYTVLTGIIYQSISGFYYVWSENQSYATKPRGNFRHLQMKPLVGDYVKFELDEEDPQSIGRLIEILPRQNELKRPNVANVDYALVVTSLTEPEFSYNLLDYFLVSVESHQIEPLIILSKYDLLCQQLGNKRAEDKLKEIKALYQSVGYQVYEIDQGSDRLDTLKSAITEGTYVVMGQSGVGKSTLLNQLIPTALINTAEISDSLNRGKHTTREVTLYRYHDGLLADTPGFSSVDFDQIQKEDLAKTFPEIREAGYNCRFRSCMHVNEPHCQVKKEVENGSIASSRYQNYLQILEKIEQRKPKY